MKYLFHFTLLLITAFIGRAQTSLEAKALLDKVSSKLASYDNIAFNFTYVLENKQEAIRQETGGSVTVSGERYKLDFMGLIQIADEDKIYTVFPENEEIVIAKNGEEETLGINPSKLLKFYESGYDYQWDIEQNLMGRKIQFVKLLPSTENEEIEYLLLGIDINTKHIYRLIEIGKSGTQTTLTVMNQKENIALAANYFSFNRTDYPDYYYVNELF